MNLTQEETRRPETGISRSELIKDLHDNLAREYEAIVFYLICSQLLDAGSLSIEDDQQ